jgi:hypothetical protein
MRINPSRRLAGVILSLAGRPAAALRLRAGDWVEVRSKEEILRTLDLNGRLAGLPFMPQMFQYCGKRLRVFKRAHKTCDTIYNTGGRSMENAVHLEGVRCDGEAYAGCGACCLIFWKEDWLKREGAVDHRADGGQRQQLLADEPVAVCTEERVQAGTRASDSTEADPRYACQATDLLRATKPLPWLDARQYLEDYFSGNVSLGSLLGGMVYFWCRLVVDKLGYRTGTRDALIRLYDRVQRLYGGVPFPRKIGRVPAGEKTPLIQIGLQPGEHARLKSYEDILGTLDSKNTNRGLYFGAEEVPYCGGTYLVRSRVNQIIEERTGRPIPIKSGGAVILENVWCYSCYSRRRMFCPRSIYPFFRETWLERRERA